nr:class C sortase [Sediminivirga luteola]
MAATLALCGVLVMLYPPAASWWAESTAAGRLAVHAEQNRSLDPAARSALLTAAEDYNATRVTGLVVDPFSNVEGADAHGIDDDARDYLAQLAHDPEGIMARVRVPGIDVDLPVYHGATEETLRRGSGHLYGSSLPVGGPGTHAVLTGHSGLPEAKLFTAVHDLRAGDDVFIDVLDRTLAYRVTGAEVVEPTDVAGLAVRPGEDLLTLVTCTPIGVNSHRLIVHAERVDLPDGGAPPEPSRPFPWWAVLAVVAVLAWAATVLAPAGQPRRH